MSRNQPGARVITLTHTGRDGRVVREPPLMLPDAVELRRDVVFTQAMGREWQLDVLLPREGRGSMPAVVYLHGGGGRRVQFYPHAVRLAASGFAGVCIQHPLRNIDVPQAAVRWVRRHAGELGVDPERLGAAGSSAGSYLACLLGILDAPEHGYSSKVQAVVSQEGAYLVGLPDDASPERRALSPYERATSSASPTLIIHAEEDPDSPFAAAAAYRDRLLELGVRSEVFSHPAAAHGLDDKTPYYEHVLPEYERFFVRELGHQEVSPR